MSQFRGDMTSTGSCFGPFDFHHDYYDRDQHCGRHYISQNIKDSRKRRDMDRYRSETGRYRPHYGDHKDSYQPTSSYYTMTDYQWSLLDSQPCQRPKSSPTPPVRMQHSVNSGGHDEHVATLRHGSSDQTAGLSASSRRCSGADCNASDNRSTLFDSPWPQRGDLARRRPDVDDVDSPYSHHSHGEGSDETKTEYDAIMQDYADKGKHERLMSFPVSCGSVHRSVANCTSDSDDDVDEHKKSSTPRELDWLGGIDDDNHICQERVSKLDVSDGKFEPRGQTVKFLTPTELAIGVQSHFKAKHWLGTEKIACGVGESLIRKMGWSEGLGLGKTNSGSLSIPMVDFKQNRSGLSTVGEKATKVKLAKTNANKCDLKLFVKEGCTASRAVQHSTKIGSSDSSTNTAKAVDKNPVSALHEKCSKLGISLPQFTLVMEWGPPHERYFIMKVTIDSDTYQPTQGSPSKKLAKASTAALALSERFGISDTSVLDSEISDSS